METASNIMGIKLPETSVPTLPYYQWCQNRMVAFVAIGALLDNDLDALKVRVVDSSLPADKARVSITTDNTVAQNVVKQVIDFFAKKES